MRSVFAIATAALFGVAVVSGQTVCQSINTFKTGAAPSAQTSQTQYDNMKGFILDVATNGANVNGKAGGLFNNPILNGYFNSTINYRATNVPHPSPLSTVSSIAPDYTASGTNQNTLVQKLTQFFGAALGCDKFTGQDYVPPTGGNQYTIHRNMNITDRVFSAFVGEIAGSAVRYNISSSTIGVVAGVLNSFKRTNVDSSASANSICAEPSCTCATTYTTSGSTCVAPASTGNQGGDASTASFSFAAIVALAAAALAIKQ